MLLTVDAGNTQVKLGLFDDAVLAHSWRLATDPHRTADEYGVFLAQLFAAAGVATGRVEGVAVASVVPHIDITLERACVQTFGVTPRFLRAHEQRLMPVLTEHPAEAGADLVAAAIAAKAGFGAPLIVASYGTATVFVAISPEGAYLGGAIAPGIGISVEALAARAAKLPQPALEAPSQAIGSTTAEALRSGVVFGYVGQAEGIVARLRAQLGSPARVVATGGYAGIVAANCELFAAVEPHLTLTGLRLFHGSASGA